MQPASGDEIRRAMEAIETAPRTESGLIIPPHVAEQQATPEPAKPNRAQRRRQEKAQRRAAKRQRHAKVIAENKERSG